MREFDAATDVGAGDGTCPLLHHVGQFVGDRLFATL
jgi:hypothetical protein